VIDRDVAVLVEKKKLVYYLAEDTAERGISDNRLVDGAKSLSRRDLPRFFEEFDQVWHWQPGATKARDEDFDPRGLA
jgi:hypothetical protein